jgi:hypothetical protein
MESLSDMLQNSVLDSKSIYASPVLGEVCISILMHEWETLHDLPTWQWRYCMRGCSKVLSRAEEVKSGRGTESILSES